MNIVSWSISFYEIRKSKSININISKTDDENRETLIKLNSMQDMELKKQILL